MSAPAERSPPLYYIVHALPVGVANEASVLSLSALECNHERRPGLHQTRDCRASYCAAVEIANRFIVRRHVWSIKTFAVRSSPLSIGCWLKYSVCYVRLMQHTLMLCQVGATRSSVLQVRPTNKTDYINWRRRVDLVVEGC